MIGQVAPSLSSSNGVRSKVRNVLDLPPDCAIRHGVTLVCTRAKATSHWVTKKDDLFNVSPIGFCFKFGKIVEWSRSDWEGIVDARVSPQLEINRAEGNQTQRSQGGREEGYQTGAFHRFAYHCAYRLGSGIVFRVNRSESCQIKQTAEDERGGGGRER